MHTNDPGRQTKVAVALGCAVAFLAAGCTASVETHTVDAAGNTTTHVSKTWGGDNTVEPPAEAPLNLTGEEDATETPVSEPVAPDPVPVVVETAEVDVVETEVVETTTPESDSRVPCLGKMKEIMLSDGETTQADIDAIPDAVLEQFFIDVAEENGISVAMLCTIADTGMLEEAMALAADEEAEAANPGKAYADEKEFANALDAAGLPCDVWMPDDPQDALVGGICWDGVNPDSAWHLYYFDPQFRDELLGQFQGLASHDAMLMGPNWAIHTEKDADVQALIPALGGEFIPSK